MAILGRVAVGFLNNAYMYNVYVKSWLTFLDCWTNFYGENTDILNKFAQFAPPPHADWD